jgi:hypothetical protein
MGCQFRFGAKLVNTVVGVHNGDFYSILKKWTINTNNQVTSTNCGSKIDKLSMILTAMRKLTKVF